MGEAFITRRGGNSKPKEPTNWTFLQAISANGTFTAQANTWYKFHCFGKSGKGGDGSSTLSNNGTNGGGGGGSGGYGCSAIFFREEQAIPITVQDSVTSVGGFISCTRGSDGVSNTSTSSTINAGGLGGNSSGGTSVNAPGAQGGYGGASSTTSAYQNAGQAGSRGGNSGGGGGSGGNSGYVGNLSGGGGGGGARLPATAYIASATEMLPFNGGRGRGGTNDSETQGSGSATNGVVLPIWSTGSIPKLYGGGSGGGGGERNAVGYGVAGTPGLVIIERGV